MLIEIGRDVIDTASSFVNYISEEYGFSKSSVWYVLNKLKAKGVIDFASRDEIGKGMSLTVLGLDHLGRMESSKNTIVDRFSDRFLRRQQQHGGMEQQLPAYAPYAGARYIML
jgi:DNA-binding PadR family transcriptional regulator